MEYSTQMDLVTVFHMNAGICGCSYANNSVLQKNLMLKSTKVLEDTIKNYGTQYGFFECIKLADLGCSSGPNAFLLVANTVKIVHAVCQKKNLKTPPEFQVFLNDIPNNDFNTLFKFTPVFTLMLENEKSLEKM
ncbi:Salicylate O-methyltransferase [Heracleum sosnowskyi]|uniref:Salicylate O-methyltransferase n=1 Tax=Heracleum sosnowskyi TaxID=360622 RepID=A0AAD8I598_9APIA|nr:Salicylate O-methyltransferase [Heracleum sosnowskyi]